MDDYRASLSYVTGANNFKTGFTYQWQFAEDPIVFSIGNVNYRTLNGIPNQVTYYTTPLRGAALPRAAGGLRAGSVEVPPADDQRRSALRSVQHARYNATTFDPVGRTRPSRATIRATTCSAGRTCRRGWAWPTIRSATGCTALKFSVSRYVLQEGKNNTNNVHPVISATNSVARTWTDSNGDRVVQGDPLNPPC